MTAPSRHYISPEDRDVLMGIPVMSLCQSAMRAAGLDPERILKGALAGELADDRRLEMYVRDCWSFEVQRSVRFELTVDRFTRAVDRLTAVVEALPSK